MVEQEHDVSWALKILEREQDYEQNLISKYFHELSIGIFGIGVPVLGNIIYRRPIWAGFHMHIACGLIGVTVGHFLKRREIDILATRDAQLRDYIIRHPEDFPPPERKKYAEVFNMWVPIR